MNMRRLALVLLVVAGCSVGDGAEGGCDEPLPSIKLRAVDQALATEMAQQADGWGFEEMAVEGAFEPVGACESVRFRPHAGSTVPNERTVLVSKFDSARSARSGYDLAAFWRLNSDVWSSSDELHWFESDDEVRRTRYECHLSLDTGHCFWLTYTLLEEEAALVTVSGFRGSEAEVESYMDQLNDKVVEQL